MRRLALMQAAANATQHLETAEGMLARYGQENERLAAINEALISRGAFIDSNYTSTPILTFCERLTCGLTSEEENQTSQHDEAFDHAWHCHY